MASIEKRGDNSYRITVSKPKSSGKGYEKEQKTVTLPQDLTEKQKEKELNRLAMLFEEEVKKGTYLDGEKITFAEFVDIWMKEYAEKELAPATLNPYRLRLEKRIIPALGHLKLARIQPQHLVSFYNNLTEEGIRMDVLYVPTPDFWAAIEGQSHKSLGEKIGIYRKTFARMKEGKGIYYESAQKISSYLCEDMTKLFIPTGTDKKLSNKTIRHHHALISSIMSTAVDWNLILNNPAERVKTKATKINKRAASKAAEANYYDDEQIIKLFTELENEPIKYKTIVYVAIDTGLRLSELAGLEWSDIDFEKKELTVNKQRQYVSHHGILNREPKSESGLRGITISDTVLNALKKYQVYQKTMKLKCGSAWYDSNNVFVHEDGKPIFPNRPSIWFSQFLERKELPKITFHGLRHTNASLLIAEDIDIVTVSGRLGHADKNVTLNTYSHIIKSKEKKAANKLDKFYARMEDSDDVSDSM